MSIIGSCQDKCTVVINTGASLVVSNFEKYFSGGAVPLLYPLYLGGMSNGIFVEGICTVQLIIKSGRGKMVTNKTCCYYVPEVKVRL